MPDPQSLAKGLMADGPVMRSYEPSWRDRMAAALMGDGRASPARAQVVMGLMGSRGLGSTGLSAVDATPAGAVLDMQQAAQHGDKAGMAMAAAGFVPGAKVAEKAVAKTVDAAGKTAKLGRMASNADISKEITEYLHKLLSENPEAFHGLRVTPVPLTESAKAPPSKQWYNDFISDEHEVFGREAFPDHGHELPGPSVVGIGGPKDINRALDLVGLNNKTGGYGHLGNNISIISGGERIHGNDAHEWILPESIVLKTWVKNSEK